jgi:flagellin-like protein
MTRTRKLAMRRGISPVIATVILTSIMLTIVAVALYYSTSLIDLNRQTMEYEYAKAQLTYVATALDQIAFGTGGSRYVRFSLTSTGISVLNTSKVVVKAWINGTWMEVYRGDLVQIQVCGGPLVTTVPRLLFPETGDLQTELNKAMVTSGEPIAVVYENFTGRACAFLVPRLRAFYSSQISIPVGSGVKKYNYIVLHIVQIKKGNLGGSGTIPLVFRNIQLNVTEYKSWDYCTGFQVSGMKGGTPLLQCPPADGGSVLVVKIATILVSSS